MEIVIKDKIDQKILDWGLDISYLDQPWYDATDTLCKNISRRADMLRESKPNSPELWELCHYSDIFHNIGVPTRRLVGFTEKYIPVNTYKREDCPFL